MNMLDLHQVFESFHAVTNLRLGMVMGWFIGATIWLGGWVL